MSGPMLSLLALLGLSVAALPAEEQAHAPRLPLDNIPTDAAMVVSWEVPQVWHHPIMTTLRTLVPSFPLEVGAREFERTLGIDLGDLQRLVVCWPDLKQPADLQRPIVWMLTRKPYDQAQILQWIRGKPDPSPVEGLLPFNETAVIDFIGPQTLAWVPRPYAARYKNPPKNNAIGPQAPIIELIGKHTLVAGMFLDRFPDELRSNALPNEVRPYRSLLLCRMVQVRADVAMPVKLSGQVRLISVDKLNTIDAERALRLLRELALQGIQEARTGLDRPGRGGKAEEAFLDFADSMIKAIAIERQGLEVRAQGQVDLKLETVAKFTRAILEESKPVIATSRRTREVNNLKQIGLAMHNFADANRGFPPTMIVDRSGQPLLSWRVAILPYIEQDNLYRQFKFDEPWDSEHNKKLLKYMPSVYAIPGQTPRGSTKTHLQVFVGGGAVFDKLLPTRIRSITDGTSNSIMVAQAAKAVPWTKPDDLDFDPNGMLPKLLFRDGITNVAFCDGSVRTLSVKIDEQVLKTMITRDGGEIVDPNP